MEELSKERAQEFINKIEFAILQSLIRFGKTRPEDSVCAISVAACNLVFLIASTTNSRKEAFEAIITILNKQKEHFLEQAKEEGYDLENL